MKIFAYQKKWNYRFQSQIWFWRLLLYKISVEFEKKVWIQRNYLVKILRFLYILGESGLLCGVLWFAINSGIPYKVAILFWCKPSKVSKMIRLANILIRKARPHKGQLFSKANFLVLIWTQKWTKLFFDFCPKDLK